MSSTVMLMHRACVVNCDEKVTTLKEEANQNNEAGMVGTKAYTLCMCGIYLPITPFYSNPLSSFLKFQ